METLAAKWRELKDGLTPAEWHQHCADLIAQHNAQLTEKSAKAMASGAIPESKVIVQANKALLDVGQWLKPFDIHLLTILLPGHYNGHASLKSARIVTASPALEQFWCDKCPTFSKFGSPTCSHATDCGGNACVWDSAMSQLHRCPIADPCVIGTYPFSSCL